MANYNNQHLNFRCCQFLKRIRKNGEWKTGYIPSFKQTDSFPKKCTLRYGGDKVKNVLQEGIKQLNISFDIENREYNGRWYAPM